MTIICKPETLYDMFKDLIAIFFKKSQLSFKEDQNEDTLYMTWTKTALELSLKRMGQETIKASFEHEAYGTHLIYDSELSRRAPSKRVFKRCLYHFLDAVYPSSSKWGILTGIRPVKIAHHLIDEGASENQLPQILTEDYLISHEKAALISEIAHRERKHLYPMHYDNVSVYICIPFCASRCLYCSFPSNDTHKMGHLMTAYTDKLIEEIIYTARELSTIGKRVDCIYIGGGTPTALTEKNFSRVLSAVTTYFDMAYVKEFTVEAGRPDTITDAKLNAMKEHLVTRLCINPQTMNNHTLKAIGRAHSKEDIERTFLKARTYGFDNINMDLILGLPDETTEDVIQTMASVMALLPESVTLHTLAVKRASKLNQNLKLDFDGEEGICHTEMTKDRIVSDMMHQADKKLREAGITPYYMYRQKKMIGHLENVGYAKKGNACLYNMRMMEERHTIVALGAGAVSKYCFIEPNQQATDITFKRIPNMKGLPDYLNRFEEVLRRKDQGMAIIK